jgi:hypothetical protein
MFKVLPIAQLKKTVLEAKVFSINVLHLSWQLFTWSDHIPSNSLHLKVNAACSCRIGTHLQHCTVSQPTTPLFYTTELKLNSHVKFRPHPTCPTEIDPGVSEIKSVVDIQMYRTSYTNTLKEICAKNSHIMKLEKCYLLQHCAVLK